MSLGDGRCQGGHSLASGCFAKVADVDRRPLNWPKTIPTIVQTRNKVVQEGYQLQVASRKWRATEGARRIVEGCRGGVRRVLFATVNGAKGAIMTRIWEDGRNKGKKSPDYKEGRT